MYPFKVVSKKNRQLTITDVVALSSCVLPVSNREEYSPEDQLAIMVEVLLGSKTKVVEMIEQDLDDPNKATLQEWPSVVRMLQEQGWLHHFLKNYQACVMDEFDELMRLISLGAVDDSACEEGLALEDRLANGSTDKRIENEANTSSLELLNPDEWPEMIRRRNSDFLNELPEPFLSRGVV